MFANLTRLVADLQKVAPPPVGEWVLVPTGGGFYAVKVRIGGDVIEGAHPLYGRPRRLAWLLADLTHPTT